MLIALVEIEFDYSPAVAHGLLDVVGRENLLPMQVQSMQDQFGSILVEM